MILAVSALTRLSNDSIYPVRGNPSSSVNSIWIGRFPVLIQRQLFRCLEAQLDEVGRLIECGVNIDRIDADHGGEQRIGSRNAAGVVALGEKARLIRPEIGARTSLWS